MGSDRTVRLWDAATQRQLRVLEAPDRDAGGASGKPIAFSHDGRGLAAAGDDGTVVIWNLEPVRPAHVLRGHSGKVLGVVFAPDGRRLATAGDDTTIKLWNLTDGAEVFTLRGHSGSVMGLAFSPDGRSLASSSMDMTMRIWDLDPPAQEVARRRWIVAQAERVVGQLLNPGVVPRAQVVARLRDDVSLVEPVREAALSILGLLPEKDRRFDAAAWSIVLSKRALPENSPVNLLRSESAALPEPREVVMPNGREAFQND